MADHTLAVAQSHAEGPHQTGYTAKEQPKRKPVQSIAKKFTDVLKFDPNQPRGPKGSPEGGRWVKGSGGIEHWTGPGPAPEPVIGRNFTSEEGYQWHEQGPGAAWAKTMPYEDQQAVDNYAGFGYREINELRRGIEPTRTEKVRAVTPEEYAAITEAPQGADIEKMVPPEGPGFRYKFGYEYARDIPSGPDKLRSHWAVVGPKVDQERLAIVTKKANQIDDLIANRGLVLDEDIVVQRGAYLPGVSVEDLEAMEGGEHVEKAFTSTFLGDAGRRAMSYPALGKWESLYQRFHKIAEHQDEVGTAIRFYITLPKGTKVASVEAARRIDHTFPRIPDPAPVPEGVDPKYWTTPDYTQQPTVVTRDLENKDQRTESEILLGSGARFRVTRVKKGYTYPSTDPTLKPVEVYEVHMEYIGGGSSEGSRH